MNTLRLSGVVAVIAVPFAMTVGLLAAMYPGTRLDRAVTFTTLGLISVPEFLVATVLVLVVAVQLGWLPATAYISGQETGLKLLRALAMPTLTLVIVAAAQIMRMTRATVLNVMSSPYHRDGDTQGACRAVGSSCAHALLNAIGPIVNIIALNLAYLVSGVVIVETVFAFPGLAKLMIDAVQTRDLPLVQACAMIFCGGLHRPDLHRGHGVDPVEPQAAAPEIGTSRCRTPITAPLPRPSSRSCPMHRHGGG